MRVRAFAREKARAGIGPGVVWCVGERHLESGPRLSIRFKFNAGGFHLRGLSIL